VKLYPAPRLFSQLCFVAAYFFVSLIGFVVSYAGIPVVVNAKSEHTDVDFDQHQIMVRDPKGMHDRTTVLPVTLELSRQAQLQAVKHFHERDLVYGQGESFPYALAQKYPNAAKEWGWQFIFPSSNLSPDLYDGKMKRYHMQESVLQKAVCQAAFKAGIRKNVGRHTFRYSLATHQLEAGYDIRTVQEIFRRA